MAVSIDYYFSLISPWAYLGHAEFLKLAQKFDAAIAYKPVALGKLFPESGGLPLGKRHPLRQAYRFLELQRWREKRNIPLVLRPKFWPFDASLADRVAIVTAQAHPEEAGTFLALAFRAVWVEEQNLAEAETLYAILASLDLPATMLLAAAQSQAAIDAYNANLSDALSVGAFGSPSYVIDGEVFWGQDRLDMLAEMIESGRAPFTVDQTPGPSS